MGNQLTTSNREMTLNGGGQPLKDDSCCLVEHRSRGAWRRARRPGQWSRKGMTVSGQGGNNSDGESLDIQ